MAIEVKIPQISEGVDSADVAEILVKEGDTVEKDQALVVLETDKASAEVPSSHAGKVKEIKINEGDEVSVGDVILTLEGEEDVSEDQQKEEQRDQEPEDESKKKRDKDEEKEVDDQERSEEKKDQKAEKDEKRKEQDEESEHPKEDSEPKNQKEDPEKEQDEPEEEKKEDDSQTTEAPASPGVRRLSRKMGVDLSTIEGSGPGGRITEEDVKSNVKDQEKAKKDVADSALPDFSKWGNTEAKPLSKMRIATAKSTTSSWQSIPHVFQFDEADISGIQKYMEEHSEAVEKEGGKLTITAILVKIAANALQQFPKFNASIDIENEEMVLKHYINISIAVATDEGLLMPVIKEVDKKNIIELAGEITAVAEKAREGKLKPDEMNGGNFSISNLGGIGGTNFTPIVYHPQVAILGISKAHTQPRYIDGSFEPREVLPLSLSYDHRLIDGAEGAAFLNWIAQALEDPYKALLG